MAKAKKRVGERIVEGLDEAIAWSQGKKTGARVTLGRRWTCGSYGGGWV